MLGSRLISYAMLILAVAIFEPIIGAQLNANSKDNEPKTADLTVLINETLSINNKTAPTASSGDNQKTPVDDWTFDMVEYDLMEFLQDLSARYKLSNKTSSQAQEPQIEYVDSLEGRQNKEKKNDTLNSSPVLVQLEAVTKKTPVEAAAPSSLASGDQEIAESSYQYGIFDRFTRPRATSTTTRAPPEPKLTLDSDGRIDLRQFNSPECGLRTYAMEDDTNRNFGLPQQHDKTADPEMSEISKSLSQRRQKLPLMSPLEFNRRKHFQEPAIDNGPSIAESFGETSGSVAQQANIADKNNNEDFSAWSTNSHNKDGSDSIDVGMSHIAAEEPLNRKPSYPTNNPPAESNEFNLASRRYWLQQQLGNTLQLLGFNSSTATVSDFLNQTSGLSVNLRENMMKSSLFNNVNKASRSVSSSSSEVDDLLINTGRELKARQDELKLEPRVIGGSDAKLGDSPWSVSLQALVSRPGTVGIEYRHYCGGTIISEHYVLTAAHCLDFMVGRESRLFVVVGDINWRMSTATLYGRRYGIDKLIIHSGYKSTAFGHDIGLIRTKEPIRTLKAQGKYIVNSVCLPEKGVEHSGEAELVGWGLFSSRNEMADSLQIADVPILPRPLCVDLYRRRTGLIQWLIGIELITDKQVCAGTFGRGICQGDSGSALVVNERILSSRNGPAAEPEMASQPEDILAGKRANVGLKSHHTRATQIGVVAFGGIRRCSYQSLPGVYMQTSKYLDWILPRIQG